MASLVDMIWVELRKAVRSRMPHWTALGALVMPLGIAFLIFVARNPDVSQRLGLVSAKANLVAYSATDWPAYLALFGQMVAAGGFLLFLLAISWIFGREFADGTIKDLLAVPVDRATVVLAKFALAAVWSAGLALVVLATGLAMGAIIGLPGGSLGVLLAGTLVAAFTSGLTIAVALPFAFLASVGRGYLLPVGVAMLTALVTNLVMLLGWGDYFPWAVPGLYAQGKVPLSPISFGLVLLTAVVGIIATCLWWKLADQNR